MGKAALLTMFGLGTVLIVYSIITLIMGKPDLSVALSGVFLIPYVLIAVVLALLEFGEEWLKIYKQKNNSTRL